MKNKQFSRREMLMASAALTAAAAVAPAALAGEARAAAPAQKTPLIGSRNVTGLETPGSRAMRFVPERLRGALAGAAR